MTFPKTTVRAAIGVSTVFALALLACVGSGVAVAATGPVWRLDALSNSSVAPGATLDYVVQATNVGDTTADGATQPITITASLPEGIVATNVQPEAPLVPLDCSAIKLPSSTVSCTSTGTISPKNTKGFGAMTIVASVSGGAPLGSAVASFTVTGGGAASVSTVRETTITSEEPGFGIAAFDGLLTADAAGGAFSQAGGNPYEISTSIDFNTITNPVPLAGDLWPVQPVKDVSVDLPPGLVGDPTAVAQCTALQLAHTQSGFDAAPLCPPTSQVGTTLLRLNSTGHSDIFGPYPVFNVVPSLGVPAQFGFNAFGNVVLLSGRVRSNSDYGISVDVDNIPEGLATQGTTVTFWGVPSDPSHDNERSCPGSQLAPWEGGPTCTSGAPPTAFLRNTTSCSNQTQAGAPGLATVAHADSWVTPGARNAQGEPDLSDPAWKTAEFLSHNPPGYPEPLSGQGSPELPTGCEKVPFTPSFTAAPVAPVSTGEPAGFAFDLSVPQSEEPGAIGQSDLKKATVTLPVGVRVNPSSADGFGACTPTQIELHSTRDPSCPDASKIGSLTIETPLLKETLSGSVFLASPHQNPFGTLIAVYLVAKGPGVVIKVPGQVTLDPATGQVTTIVDNSPQLPFSKLHIELNSGPRAALVLPNTCGSYSTHSALSPWSEPDTAVNSDSGFTLSQATSGTGCPTPQFTPNLTAGTVNPVAGAFTPFTLQLTRTDQDGELGSIPSLTLPPGLLADVGSVSSRCTDAQASTAACPVASRIGSVTTGAGAGTNPYYVTGNAYLTGPYEGYPFGLAVIVHAQAGPFDLGYVTVRAAVQVNDDGSITTKTDPFPTILQGIPLQVRDIRVNLDRPNFVLNPTNCAPMNITGTVNATDGRTAPVSNRFQVGECSRLPFKPGFTVSTGSLTGRNIGASLVVKVTSGKGQANVHGVHVSLPKALPSRNTTLQQACPNAVFSINPAACPAGSVVGIVRATTPILAVPLTGPAYLVSHGGAAFPDLVLVLQGENITLHVTGHTNIKNGVTTSTFNTVPDAPITNFELRLPTGPHSALAAPAGHLCSRSLTMPTTLTGQNGAVIKKTTKIAVTGCPRHKAKRARRRK